MDNPQAREAARALASAGEETLRRFVPATRQEAAEPLAAYVVTVMTGLSAMARQDHGPDRLAATAIERGLRDGPAGR